MSTYPLPQSVDKTIAVYLINKMLRPCSGINGEITFSPDLDATEEAELNSIFRLAESLSSFESLPSWAEKSPAEISQYVIGLIHGGKTIEEIYTQIDNLPNNVDGMKAGLKSVADDVVAIRSVLSTTAKAVVWLRNFLLKVLSIRL